MSRFFLWIRDFFSNGLISSISVFDIIDILLMWAVIYNILKFVKNTKAMHLLKGVGVLFIALMLSSLLGLSTLSWILSSIFTSGIVVIVVLFQPEMRRAIENLGRGHFNGATEEELDAEKSIDEVVFAADRLSRRHVGALMVFTQKSEINDIIATGTSLDAKISAGLIENVFEPNTPLHDGAMVLTGNKIIAAGCFLPLSENNTIEKTLGTRHRAALGMSEHSDAVIIVVSEETGVISAAHGGNLQRYLDLDGLRSLLNDIYSSYTVQKTNGSLLSKLFGKDNNDEK